MTEPLEKIRVYIAAPFKFRDEAKKVSEAFEAAGYEMTSTWITREHDGGDALTDETAREWACQDMMDIDRSQAVVVLNLDYSDGKATEMGYAYGCMLPIMVIGDKSRNIFYHLPAIKVEPTVEAAIAAMNAAVDEAREFDAKFRQAMLITSPEDGLVN